MVALAPANDVDFESPAVASPGSSMNRMFKLTLALLAVLALTGSALAQISNGTVDKKGNIKLPSSLAAVANYGRAVRSGSFASVEDKSMASALPVGDLSDRTRNDRHEPNG